MHLALDVSKEQLLKRSRNICTDCTYEVVQTAALSLDAAERSTTYHLELALGHLKVITGLSGGAKGVVERQRA